MKNRELIIKIVSLALASIMILSILFGVLASIAYADGVNYSPVRSWDLTGNGLKTSNLAKGTYSDTWTLSLTLGASFTNKNIVRVSLYNSDDLTTFDKNNVTFKYDTSSSSTPQKPRYKISGVKVLVSTNTVPILVEFDDPGIVPPVLNLYLNSGGSDGYIGDYYDDYDRYSSSSSDTSSEKEVLTTPKMIVTRFSAPKMVNPGDTFELNFSFMNNSTRKNLENISVTVEAPDTAPLQNTTNKRHYLVVPSRKVAQETFMLKASKELKLETIPVKLKFDYEYKLDGQYVAKTSEEIIYISSTPKEEEKKEDTNTTEGEISAFEILSVIPPTDLFAGEEGYVTVKVINKDHRFNASNVQLTVTGDGLTNNGATEYHGALNKSSQGEIEMPLQFDKPGEYTLKAIVVYEDSVGLDDDKKPIVRINEKEREFKVTVNEAPKQGDMGMGMGNGQGMPGGEGQDVPAQGGVSAIVGKVTGFVSSMKPYMWWIIDGAVVLIIAAIVVFKVIKRKRAEAEDEDN